MKCGYAINAALDVERSRRAAQGIVDEDSWAKWYAAASHAFDAGELASHCGKTACLVVIHRNGGIYPYCVDHFCADTAVANGNLLVLHDETFTPELAARVHSASPNLRSGFPEDGPLVSDFVRAVHVWIGRGPVCI